jgi:DNA primase
MAGDTVSRIKERIDVVELIGTRVQLRQAGRNFKGLCPFHNEKTPSFVVFPESQSYHCFGCGKSGDIFSYVMDTENLDFADAMNLLAERAGVEITSFQPKNPEKDAHLERLVDLVERAGVYFSSMLWTSPAGQPARDLLERRGVDRQTAEQFGLGFAPDSWDSLRNHLLRRGDVDDSLLLEAGLLTRNESGRTYDRFRNRLMFPIRNRSGRTIGFGARALGDEMPKYLNSPQTPIFNKSELLYALDRAHESIRRERSLIVVEGYMDAIAAHQYGYTNAVASMGTALTSQQVSSIRRYVDKVFLALDADAAGQMATMRAIDAVRESFSADNAIVVDPNSLIRFERALDAEVRIVALTGGKDPDEMIRSDQPAWDRALRHAVPLVEYVLTRQLADVEPTPAARAEALHDVVVPYLREIRDPAILSHYVGLASRLLGYKDTDIRAALRRRTSQDSRAVPSRDRPVARDPERHLFAMLMRHATIVDSWPEILEQIDPGDLIDARNREILRIMAVTGAEAVIDSVSEPIQEYISELLQDIPERTDWSPGLVRKDISQAILTLSRTRHLAREHQVRRDLQAAKAEGNAAEVLHLVQQLTDLAEHRRRFDPETSPYFKDTRTASF